MDMVSERLTLCKTCVTSEGSREGVECNAPIFMTLIVGN